VAHKDMPITREVARDCGIRAHGGCSSNMGGDPCRHVQDAHEQGICNIDRRVKLGWSEGLRPKLVTSDDAEHIEVTPLANHRLHPPHAPCPAECIDELPEAHIFIGANPSESSSSSLSLSPKISRKRNIVCVKPKKYVFHRLMVDSL
jgi:hypothetical protein